MRDGVRTAALLVAGLSVGLTAHAQDALYGRQPPPGSAYIRFVNATPQPLVVSSDVHPEMRLGADGADRVAPYLVVENAANRKVALVVGGKDFVYQPAPGGYATLVFGSDGHAPLTMAAITDHADFNQTRARFAFYNLAPGCKSAALALQPGGQAVFSAVAFDATQSRTVNPVQAPVKAVCDGADGPGLTLSGMEVGASYSVWLIGTGPTDALTLTKDSTAPLDPKG